MNRSVSDRNFKKVQLTNLKLLQLDKDIYTKKNALDSYINSCINTLIENIENLAKQNLRKSCFIDIKQDSTYVFKNRQFKIIDLVYALGTDYLKDTVLNILGDSKGYKIIFKFPSFGRKKVIQVILSW